MAACVAACARICRRHCASCSSSAVPERSSISIGCSLKPLVDAVNGSSTLTQMAEAVKQVAVADRLVITKTDLAPTEGAAALRAQLRAVNPQAQQLEAVRGVLDPTELSGLSFQRARIDDVALARWLGPVDPQ